jgi:hypothetical protein
VLYVVSGFIVSGSEDHPTRSEVALAVFGLEQAARIALALGTASAIPADLARNCRLVSDSRIPSR